jgi:hypothetical protein
MGRITPVWKLQKELEFAQKRQTYLARTDKPVKQTVDKRIKTLVGYRSSLILIGTTNALIELQVSQEALTKYGGTTALGLLAGSDTLMDTAIKEPKGFTPAQIKGLVGTSTPTVATAKGSGRRYIKYGVPSAGNTQSSFTCAVSSGDVNPTPAEQAAKAKTVADTVKAAFNADADGYGRLWFEAEQYSSPLV